MDSDFILNQATYEWTVKAFNRIRRHLRLKIKLHGDSNLLENGEIFVFNHFARIETFLPHYLIYQKTGALCRSIGSKILFDGNEAFAKYLINVGVIPNDSEELLPLLVADILKGRKVIIFPEGGMVKDRKVVDENGKFKIYSREAQIKRKHHTGAAILACVVNTVKQAIICADKSNDSSIEHWLKILEVEDKEQLLLRANKPTIIIPCNITFYPMNNDENFLSRKGGFFNKKLGEQAKEELIIESNLLLKDTDMDMRLGDPINLLESQSWWERKTQLFLSRNLVSINHFFTLDGINKLWIKIIHRTFRKSSEKVRDKYMKAIYQGTTINILHIASAILLKLFSEERYKVELNDFYLRVYLAIKKIQEQEDVNLHRGLLNPTTYTGLVFSDKAILQKFLESAEKSDLIVLNNPNVILQEGLCHNYDRSTVRIKNIIQVYNNEMAAVSGAARAVDLALHEFDSINQKKISRYLYDDELRSFRWHYQRFNRHRFYDINQKETATESGLPFLLLPESKNQKAGLVNNKVNALGIVLVHGFLASPAEIKPIADKLSALGYPVYGVRLAGHGTSPVDLRNQNWESWVDSVRLGCKILKPYAQETILLGFSSGSIASLLYASQEPSDIAAIISINPPVKFLDKKMWLVPLIHKVNKVLSTISPLDNVVPYRANNSEHPDINYSSIPVTALNQLLQMINALKGRLALIKAPCLFIQSSKDPVIAGDSLAILKKGLLNSDVTTNTIESNRHGILYESVGLTHKLIVDYVGSLQVLLDPKNDCVREGNKNE